MSNNTKSVKLRESNETFILEVPEWRWNTFEDVFRYKDFAKMLHLKEVHSPLLGLQVLRMYLNTYRTRSNRSPFSNRNTLEKIQYIETP